MTTKTYGISRSGEFERDQIVTPEGLTDRETMHACPMQGCTEGQIRTERPIPGMPGRYSVHFDECGLCEGDGVVTKARAAEYLSLVGPSMEACG